MVKEHQIKTIERRRFINAVNKLKDEKQTPQSISQTQIQIQNNKDEEKEQTNELEFDKMIDNVENIIKQTNSINKKQNKNITSVINNVNNICDEIEMYIKQLRKSLIENLKTIL